MCAEVQLIFPFITLCLQNERAQFQRHVRSGLPLAPRSRLYDRAGVWFLPMMPATPLILRASGPCALGYQIAETTWSRE